MKAIILAAGRGSRMNTLTDDRPKCLVKLRGRTLLDWQLQALREAGITEIAIVTGYRRELLVNYNLVEFNNPRWAQTNMVSSLACAHEWLELEPCIVSYSDIFFEASAISSLMGCLANLAVMYDPNWLALWSKRFVDPLVDAETFRIDSGGSLLEIGGKPCRIEEVQGQYMGLLRISPMGWAEINCVRIALPPDEFDHIHMTNLLQRVIDSGGSNISAIAYEGKWGEVDSVEDLSKYNVQIRQR